MSKYLLSWLLFTALTVTAHADTFHGQTKLSDKKLDEVTIYGPATLSEIKTKILNITGPLEFTDLEVTQKAKIIGPTRGKEGKFHLLSIIGPLEAHELKCESLKVIGSVTLREGHISHKAQITGSLNANDSEFQQLTIKGSEITLQASTAEDIFIEQIDHQEQTLILKNGSLVEGDVIFESGKGKVTLSQDSEVKGSIKGAAQVETP